jgi:hypothetical protein
MGISRFLIILYVNVFKLILDSPLGAPVTWTAAKKMPEILPVSLFSFCFTDIFNQSQLVREYNFMK